MLLRGKHYRTGRLVDIRCTDGIISAISDADLRIPADREEEYIAPGLFDIQINGCLGIDFASKELTVERIRTVVEICSRHGVYRFFPTLITNDFESIALGFRTLRAAREAETTLAKALPGFHLEGPYISSENGPRGAHPLKHVRDPDWDEFRRWQDFAGGLIRLVTLAPERDGAIEFIERLVQSGVIVALGHTAASGAKIREAIQTGARLSTHLGNGCASQMHRHENPIWEQLAADELMASVIADGFHLPASVLKSIVRAKGVERIILTCDAGSLAGLPLGRYNHWGSELELLPNGKIVLAGTSYLAGSGVFLDTCVRNVIQSADVTLTEAVEMASHRPARLFGLPVYDLEVGHPAEFYFS